MLQLTTAVALLVARESVLDVAFRLLRRWMKALPLRMHVRVQLDFLLNSEFFRKSYNRLTQHAEFYEDGNTKRNAGVICRNWFEKRLTRASSTVVSPEGRRTVERLIIIFEKRLDAIATSCSNIETCVGFANIQL